MKGIAEKVQTENKKKVKGTDTPLKNSTNAKNSQKHHKSEVSLKRVKVTDLKRSISGHENPEVNHPKTKILADLSRQLHEKVEMDEHVKIKLFEEEHKRLLQQKKIQQHLEAISNQNERWRSQLERFVKEIETKKNKILFSAESVEEQQLIKQYQKVLKEEQDIKLTKLYRSMVEREEWKEINREKQKITSLLRDNTKKLAFIARSKSHELPKNKAVEEKPKEDKIVEVKKNIRKSKSIEELKEMGRQYLEHAKHAEKNKADKLLLKLDNKNIDYPTDVKELIKLKVDNLSMKPEIGFGSTFMSKKRGMKSTLISKASSGSGLTGFGSNGQSKRKA